MFCQQCGLDIPQGARFCGACGQPAQAPAGERPLLPPPSPRKANPTAKASGLPRRSKGFLLAIFGPVISLASIFIHPLDIAFALIPDPPGTPPGRWASEEVISQRVALCDVLSGIQHVVLVGGLVLLIAGLVIAVISTSRRD